MKFNPAHHSHLAGGKKVDTNFSQSKNKKIPDTKKLKKKLPQKKKDKKKDKKKAKKGRHDDKTSTNGRL